MGGAPRPTEGLGAPGGTVRTGRADPGTSGGSRIGRRASRLGSVWGTCTPVTGAPPRGGAGGQVEAAALSPRGGSASLASLPVNYIQY